MRFFIKKGISLFFPRSAFGFRFTVALDDFHAIVVRQLFGLVAFGYFVVFPFISDVRAEAAVEYFEIAVFGERFDDAVFLLFPFFLDESNGFVESNGLRGIFFGQRDVFVVVADIRAETSCRYRNDFSFVFSEVTGQFKEFQGFFEGDGIDRLAFLQGGKERFLLVVGNTDLHQRTEASIFTETGRPLLGSVPS